MNDQVKIPGSDEAWETGLLGRDEAFVGVADEALDAVIDHSLELQPISIRLQKSLIEDLKAIAKLNGLRYQTLVRQVLTRFADYEKKNLLRQLASERDALNTRNDALEDKKQWA
jgi:hypothetical protein